MNNELKIEKLNFSKKSNSIVGNCLFNNLPVDFIYFINPNKSLRQYHIGLQTNTDWSKYLKVNKDQDVRFYVGQRISNYISQNNLV
jgi:poly(3-hydroxyalkanoate) synthetase